MANKGKAPMDFRQEELEEKVIREQSRLRQVRLQRWQEDWQVRLQRWHEDWELCSPIPSPTAVRHGHNPQDFVLRGIPPSQTQSILPGEGTSTPRHPKVCQYKTDVPNPPTSLIPAASPNGIPASAARKRFLETIHRAQVRNFWERTAAPVPPSQGPWYQFTEGLYRFRYGASLKEIAYTEYELEDEREAGIIREEDPLGGERLEFLSLQADSREEQQREPSEDEEVEDDMMLDDEEEAENEAEMEEEDEIEEDQSSEPQSTITDEPSVM